MTMITRRTFAKGTAAVPVLGAAALSGHRVAGAQGEPVRIGSKNFTEQYILGEMYRALLENVDIPVEMSLNLGGTGIAHEALINDEISLYPEYTGTALLEILDLDIASLTPAGTPAASPVAPAAATPAGTPAAAGGIDQLVYDTVAREYLGQFQVVLLEQTPFNNTQALAIPRALSEEEGITSISQLAEVAGEYIISAPADFSEREDGLLGLQSAYGAGFADIEVLSVDPSLKYQAIEGGQAQIVLAFGTDAQIAALDLIVLDDDLGLWPPYHVAPFVRQDALDAYPAIADALNAVAPLLTDEAMQGLNGQVDLDGEEPEAVARLFLQEQGLIPAE